MPHKAAHKSAKPRKSDTPKAKTSGPATKKSAVKPPARSSGSVAKAKPAPKAKPHGQPTRSSKSHAPVKSGAATRARKAEFNGMPGGKVETTAWHKKQRQKLIELRDSMLDAMDGVARDTLRARPEGSEASAFGMHQADAGSDAYDRDFALSMLSKEQDALYEIEEALRRLDKGSYGICEMSHKKIPQLRLDAIPFARYTVECQTQLEKENRGGYGRRPPVRSLFGLGTEEGDEEEGESEGASTTSNAEANE
jgi:RNA polymerase-binding transcription factor DksA